MTTPRRPARLTDAVTNAAESAAAAARDPAARLEAAHTSAAAVVARLGDPTDDRARARMTSAIDSDDGLEAAARLWAAAAPVSLPGALWRLVALRHGVRHHPVEASRDFDAGRAHVPVAEVVAGVADPPGPLEVRQLVDDVLAGVGGVDFDTTLERAAAFARVMAVGRSFRADDLDRSASPGTAPGSGPGEEPGPAEPDDAGRLTRSAAALVTMAGHLEAAARAWRAGSLD
ncbi:MAG: hypothetical protein ACFCVF_01390 [Kineosporiaceae bacterium]